ncbi:MAG: type II toxin-antitoxin system HicB family antitoxin [Candidatus Latescibacterota bacterium]
MKHKIVIRHSEDGYSIYVPDIPGCWSQGAAEEEAVENIKAVMEAMEDLFPGEEICEIDIAV